MRQFWLLLLLMVLPVQMSWAAIHHCDDTTAESAAVLAVAFQTQDGAAASHSDEQGSTDTSAKNSPSAHPCHGLHQLMAHAPKVIAEATKAKVLASPEPLFCPSVLASRRERPQWSAA